MPERAQRLVFAGFCALFSCPDGRVWEWGGWKWPDGLVASKGDGWLSAALCRQKMAFLEVGYTFGYAVGYAVGYTVGYTFYRI